MRQKIRLVCRLCDRDDFYHVDSLPIDWFSVQTVQDYEAALRQACPGNNVRFGHCFTHLGVCPECYEAEIRLAIVSHNAP